MVSVVIPCYNGARFLAEAIQSCLDQSIPPHEVIVVDDGSTDDSSTIAGGFGPLVRLVSQPNRGVSAARNAGIRAATGSHIMLLDADDRMLPGCIERRMALLGEADFLIGSYAIEKHKGLLEPRLHDGLPATRVDFDAMLGGAYCVGQSGMLVRREFFDRVGGFDPLLAACEDWDWQVRACAASPAVFDPEPMVAYRQVEGSASRQTVKMADGITTVMRKNRIFATSRPRFLLAAWRGTLRTAGSIVFRRSIEEGGWSTLLKVIRQRPGLTPYFAAWMVRVLVRRVARA